MAGFGKKAAPSTPKGGGFGSSSAGDASPTPSQGTNLNSIQEYSPVWKEGYLTKEGRVVKNWKRRYFVLRQGTITYYKAKDKSVFKGSMALVGCQVKSLGMLNEAEGTGNPEDPFLAHQLAASGSPNQGALDKKEMEANLKRTQSAMMTTDANEDKDESHYKYKFMVDGPGRQLNMAAISEEDRRDWMQKIQDCINVENYLSDCAKYEIEPLMGVINVLADNQIKHLSVRDESLTLDAAKALSDVLGRNTFVTRLVISNAGLTDGFMSTLAAGLSHNDVLTSVDLSHNRIGDDGIADLINDGLYVNISLQHLCLSHNVIGDVGAVHLSDLLRANVSLKNVDVSHNLIRARGALSLSRAISTNSFLETLELGSNQIGNQGAIHLSEGLKQNKSLQKIGLSYNNIGEDGMLALCDAISSNKSMTDIDLVGNNFEKRGASALVNALKDHSTLSRVDIGNNSKLDKDSITSLAEVLKSRYAVSKLVMKRSTSIASSSGNNNNNNTR